MNIVMIPGYATEARFGTSRVVPSNTAGFRGLYEQVLAGEAVAFHWGVRVDHPAWKAWTFFPWWKLYREESRMVHEEKVQQQLIDFLNQHQPSVLVCHSLGGRLVSLTANRMGLPACVTKVVMVQSDAAHSVKMPETNVDWVNVWCPWDPSLLFSAMLNLQWRAGLGPLRKRGVRNVFWPLWRGPNLHVSSLRSRRMGMLVK